MRCTIPVSTLLASYTLPANIESLVFSGNGAHAGTGNELDNLIYGSSGKDMLYGLDGNDSLNSFGGGDTFYGGPGDDLYDVSVGDVAIELPGEGIDQITTFLPTFVLPANIENLEAKFSSAQAYGNELDNKITVAGGAGAAAFGLGGNDTLNGGIGSDTLDGGAGDDTAVFSQNLDDYTLTDFGSKIVVSGPDGADTLIAIEHLQFADGTHQRRRRRQRAVRYAVLSQPQPGCVPGRRRTRSTTSTRPAGTRGATRTRSSTPRAISRSTRMWRRAA